ncbi:MAG: cytochrome b [Pseudomonadales bacterium]
MAISLKNTSNRFGMLSITLHWVMALAIIGMYPLGLYIDSLGYYDAAYRTVPHWHKSIGMLVLGLLLLRLLWRAISVHPQSLPQPALQQIATKVVHLLMYGLMLVALVSGYMISTADGRAIAVFSWFEVPALPALVEQQEDVAGSVHYWSTTLLIILAGVHALAALKHHFINKDQTLLRMLGATHEN